MQLHAIAARVALNWPDQEDLFQEAMLHLWRQENLHPGQTLSWYLQSCSFHLRNLKAAGRSLDSPKRASGRIQLPSDGSDHDLAHHAFMLADGFHEISARDLLETLTRRLLPRERRVLDLRLRGTRIAEIAKRLRLSPHTVIRILRKIVSSAEKLRS